MYICLPVKAYLTFLRIFLVSLCLFKTYRDSLSFLDLVNEILWKNDVLNNICLVFLCYLCKLKK